MVRVSVLIKARQARLSERNDAPFALLHHTARRRFTAMNISVPDVTSDVTARQARRYRQMSPDEKLALADGIWDLAWDAVKAGVRHRHPALDEASVNATARDVFRRAAD